DLDGPSPIVVSDGRVPDAVPLPGEDLRIVRDLAVGASTRGVYLEEKPVAVIEERVNDDRQPVIDGKVGVANQLGRDDPVRMDFLARDADVEGLFVEEDSDVRALGRGPARDRLALGQRADGRGCRPIRLIEATVQVNGSGRAAGV